MSDSDEYLAAIRAARAREVDAQKATREAVARARVAGCSWSEVGGALEVSKQAARERFLVLEQLAKAWAAIELHVDQISTERGWEKTRGEAVERLVADGTLDERHRTHIRRLLRRLADATGGEQVSVSEGDLLTDGIEQITARLLLAHEPVGRESFSGSDVLPAG